MKTIWAILLVIPSVIIGVLLIVTALIVTVISPSEVVQHHPFKYHT